MALSPELTWLWSWPNCVNYEVLNVSLMQLINAFTLLMLLSQISTNDGVQVQKEDPCGTPSQLLTEVKITLKP